MKGRQLTLLLIVAVLALVRFVIIPLDQYNNEAVERIKAKQLRFEKGEDILATRDEVSTGLEEIQKALVGYQDTFPKMKSIEDGKLQVQRRITALAKENNVVIDSAEWVQIAEGNPVSGTLELQFSGEFYDVIQWHFSLEEIGSWLSADYFSFIVNGQNTRIKRHGKSRGSFGVQVLFIAEGA